MKSVRMLFSLVLTAVIIFGFTAEGNCEIIKETREVKNFDEVVFGCPGELTIIQGDKESLVIEADDDIMKYIETYVSGHTLKIKMDDRAWHRKLHFNYNIDITLYLKNINELMVSGSGEAESEKLISKELKLWVSGSGDLDVGKVEAKFLNLKVSGSGSIQVDDLKSEEVDARISGSGEIDLGGKTTRQDITISGSGGFMARNLECDTAVVQVSGSGDVVVRVEKELDVNVSGSSDVEYYGDPNVRSRVSGSGDVRRRKG